MFHFFVNLAIAIATLALAWFGMAEQDRHSWLLRAAGVVALFGLLFGGCQMDRVEKLLQDSDAAVQKAVREIGDIKEAIDVALQGATQPRTRALQLVAALTAQAAECDARQRAILLGMRGETTQEEWLRNTSDMTQAISDCMDQYSRRYLGAVIATHDQLLALGAKDKGAATGTSFDELARFPTNPLGLRELAARLSATVETLPPEPAIPTVR